MRHPRAHRGEGERRRPGRSEQVEHLWIGPAGEGGPQPRPEPGVLRVQADLSGIGRSELEGQPVEADRPRPEVGTGPTVAAVEGQIGGRPVPGGQSRRPRGGRRRPIDAAPAKLLESPPVADVDELVRGLDGG